jgi:hypothetical protein
MAINIATDISVTTGGKLTDIGAVQGGWRTVATYSDMASLTGSAILKGKLQNGQIFYISADDSLYSLTIAGSGPSTTYTFDSFTFPGSAVAGTISSSAQIASDISGAFVSLSSSIASRFDTLGGVGGIFTLTGSFYSTTNNIQITGSLSVSSGSFEGFKVDNVGRTIIGDSSNLNLQPIEGGILYSGSMFYLGM